MSEESINEKGKLFPEMDWAIRESFSQSALSNFIEEIENQYARTDVPFTR